MIAQFDRIADRARFEAHPSLGGGAHLGGEDLYLFIPDFLRQQIAEITAAFHAVDDNAIVRFYNAEWARYRKMCDFLGVALRYALMAAQRACAFT